MKEVVTTEGIDNICNADLVIFFKKKNQFDVSKNLYIHLLFLLLIKIATNNLRNANEHSEESLF